MLHLFHFDTRPRSEAKDEPTKPGALPGLRPTRVHGYLRGIHQAESVVAPADLLPLNLTAWNDVDEGDDGVKDQLAALIGESDTAGPNVRSMTFIEFDSKGALDCLLGCLTRVPEYDSELDGRLTKLREQLAGRLITAWEKRTPRAQTKRRGVRLRRRAPARRGFGRRYG